MSRPDVATLAAGVLAGERAALGQAITLVESSAPRHHDDAQALLAELLPASGDAHRVGITGVPGVGKSTFIEALGCVLTAAGRRVAVLAVDPSSTRTGGSILGDKTRMARLGVDPNAFIRPSPTSGSLGGVARATRESIVVCEAAGYDVVLVETVGVGQSETMVADMVDMFLVLMLPNAGDSLQGIKKGILELADLVAVNKADLDPHRAAMAAREYADALHLLMPRSETWTPPVRTVSGVSGEGLAELWEMVELHRSKHEASGELAERRVEQRLHWMWSMVDDRLRAMLRESDEVQALLPDVEAAVRADTMTPTAAADHLLRTVSGMTSEKLGEPS